MKNFFVEFQILLQILGLTVENISNEAYRLHGSGIDASGINFIIGFESNF